MHGCTVARNHFHRSTFSFSESRTTFSFAGQKKKWFYPQGVRPIRKAAKPPTAGLWPQLGRQKSDFPRKGHAPSVRRHSTHRARAVSKRHSRQETACRHRPIRSPGRAGKYTNVKTHPRIQSQLQNPLPPPFLLPPSSPIGNSFPSRTKLEIFIHPNATKLYIPVHIGPFSP